jgi:hypothetical protein
MQRLWNWLAERAHRRSIRVAATAERDLDRAEWWADVQGWADGVGPWPGFFRRRRPQTGKG